MMYSRSIKVLLFFVVLWTIPCAAQTSDDEQKQRQAYEEKVQESLNERIHTFLSDLDADEFQKEIIKQKLESYYEKKKDIFMNASLKYYERDEQVTSLDTSHFSDIKNMVSEVTMDKILLFIKDAGATLEKQNKKKKKNKRKKD